MSLDKGDRFVAPGITVREADAMLLAQVKMQQSKVDLSKITCKGLTHAQCLEFVDRFNKTGNVLMRNPQKFFDDLAKQLETSTFVKWCADPGNANVIRAGYRPSMAYAFAMYRHVSTVSH